MQFSDSQLRLTDRTTSGRRSHILILQILQCFNFGQGFAFFVRCCKCHAGIISNITIYAALLIVLSRLLLVHLFADGLIFHRERAIWLEHLAL